jgi:hypothetical protein
VKHPAYCCQSCGAPVGYIGRFLQRINVSPHVCPKPPERILVDREGVAYLPKREVVLKATRGGKARGC